MNAQVTLPKQYVRFRILNAEIERGYDLGMSDNRSFYIIANDGGLLNAPVSVKRVKMMPGERIEIMVNLGDDAMGSSIDLKAFNT
jgi:bilirubin oxidase